MNLADSSKFARNRRPDPGASGDTGHESGSACEFSAVHNPHGSRLDWVGASDCSLTPPEEPCVRVSPHTARAFPRTARLRVVPLHDKFVASWGRIVTLSGNLAILVGGRFSWRSSGR